MMHMNLILDGLERVSGEAFENYLKECPDYVRDVWSGGAAYRYKHNNKVFAEVRIEDGQEVAYVLSELLTS